jgi:hypothetical protein
MQTRFISRDEMEIITETILNKAKIPCTWQGNVVPTNIDSLIEFEYGLEISWENIDHFAPNEVVLAAILPKRKLICMNETKQALFEEKMGTMNFSKAHELGHWVLHIIEQQNYEQLSFDEHETFFCRSLSKKPPQEFQADMFAASILMPKDIVCGAINQLKESGNIGFPALYRLKDAFEVSISALVTRAQELKLLYVQDKKVYLSEAEAMGQCSLL